MAQGRDLAAGLEAPARALLELAAQEERADGFSFSPKEMEILQLYDRVFEQQLEEALRNQRLPEETDVDNLEQQLEEAERELLEARATLSVQRKVVQNVLMTEPSIQAVHSIPSSPLEKALLPLLNRRDVLSLAYENLVTSKISCIRELSDAEVSNMQSIKQNQELVQSLFELTGDEKSPEDEISDPQLKEEIDALKAENKSKKADWTRMKRLVSASISASGIDWASDEGLEKLVLDDDTFDHV